MLKSLCAVMLVTSALAVSPALAATAQTPTPQTVKLALVAMTPMHKMLPWCSAHVKTHCRHHVHKAAAKAT
jgi:hypothetical protein